MNIVTIIGISLMCITGLSWIIIIAVRFKKELYRIQAESGLTAHVKCEKCGTEYDVKAEECAKSFMTKSVYVKTPKYLGTVKEANYRYFAKKFYCPTCGKKKYAEIVNHSELVGHLREDNMKVSLKYILLMLVGAYLIMLFFSVPLTIADKFNEYNEKKAKEEQIERIRQEYYEKKSLED